MTPWLAWLYIYWTSLSVAKKASIEVSFVVLNWRKLDKTLAAIKTIRAQQSTSLEVIVVDNESRPADRPALKKAADVVITNEQNLGFARGCNQGAAVAQGKYLAFVNNDALLPADWLTSGLIAIAKHPSLVAVAGGEELNSRQSYGLARVDSRTALVYQSTNPVGAVTFTPYAYGSNLLVKKESFDAVQGFEESYFAYYEDVDLGAKLAAHDWRSALLPGMTIKHEVGASTGTSRSSFRNDLIQRNKYRYIARHFSWWGWYLVVTAFFDVAKFVVGSLVALIKPQSRTSRQQKLSVYTAQLKAAGWAIGHAFMLGRSRRDLQAAGHYGAGLRQQLKQS